MTTLVTIGSSDRMIHRRYIQEIEKKFVPLGRSATLMLVPSSYDERHVKDHVVRFEKRVYLGKTLLFLPREKLILAVIDKVAEVNGKVFYNAVTHGVYSSQRIVRSEFCAEVNALELGPFISLKQTQKHISQKQKTEA